MSRLRRESGVGDGAAPQQAPSSGSVPAARRPAHGVRSATLAEVAGAHRPDDAATPLPPTHLPAPARDAPPSRGIYKLPAAPAIAEVNEVGSAAIGRARAIARPTASISGRASTLGLSGDLFSFVMPRLHDPSALQSEWRGALEGLGKRLARPCL
jgi:hypothetical protein